MKRKFNGIDLLLIIVLVGVAFAGYKYLTKDEDGGTLVIGKQKVVIVAECYEVEPDVCNNINIGDPAVASGYQLDAEITDVVIEDDVKVEAINGELVVVQDPTKKHVVITFEGMANRYGPYMDLGGQELKVGKTYYMKTDKMQIFGSLISVKMMGE